MTRMRGIGQAHRPLRHRGLDGGSQMSSSYRMHGEDHDAAAFIARTAVEAPHLAVPVTMFPPRVVLVGFPDQFVSAAHLSVVVTMFAPKVTERIATAHLDVPVTMFPSVVFLREHLAVGPELLNVIVKMHPPTVFAPDAYFLTPIEDFLHVPSIQRLEWLGTGVPRSVRYRQFLRTQVGKEIVIGGVTYGGGRWHGPLTATQIAAITAAGYADRIVLAAEPGLLPVGLD